ncbi:MAG: threonine synthase [Firmicutes bacterium]|nr:threonine synthase [Bacillota bacterium]
MTAWKGVIEEYREFLPVTDDTPVVTLLEGWTPLIEARRLGRSLGISLFLKFEGANPTGSFKDRGMTMAISKACEDGMSVVMCASTGNTSASAAAYAARAGLRCMVVIPEGAIAMGKLAQAVIHGAEVVAIRGNFDQALAIVRELTSLHRIALVNSINPFRIEGQKTAAFEVCDQLGRAPDCLAIPVGNAGNITAYWKGFRQYAAHGRASSLPRMLGFQAEGAAPIVLGYPVDRPETIATAIKIGNPASWKGAQAAVDESGGTVAAVSDDEILEAYEILASQEGVFAEPASCASVAGVIKTARRRGFSGGETVVAVLTGHGLKDPERAIAQSRPAQVCDADPRAVERLIEL